MNLVESRPGIVWVITTCLCKDNQTATDPSAYTTYEQRRVEYIRAIFAVLKYRLPEERVLIVENTGLSSSFLDEFRGCEVHYTSSQNLPINKGVKELMDIQSCLKTYNIPNDTTVIKITGRYFLKNNDFANIVRSNTDRGAIFRAGSAFEPKKPFAHRSTDDCCSGLIAMKAHYWNQMDVNQLPQNIPPIEWIYALFIKQYIPNYLIIDCLGLSVKIGAELNSWDL